MNLDDAEFAKEEFREKWNKKYPNILKSWDKNWAELTVFFEYPQEIRKIIYTTNAVEGYHRMVRKFTKSKSIFQGRLYERFRDFKEVDYAGSRLGPGLRPVHDLF